VQHANCYPLNPGTVSQSVNGPNINPLHQRTNDAMLSPVDNTTAAQRAATNRRAA